MTTDKELRSEMVMHYRKIVVDEPKLHPIMEQAVRDTLHKASKPYNMSNLNLMIEAIRFYCMMEMNIGPIKAALVPAALMTLADDEDKKYAKDHRGAE